MQALFLLSLLLGQGLSDGRGRHQGFMNYGKREKARLHFQNERARTQAKSIPQPHKYVPTKTVNKVSKALDQKLDQATTDVEDSSLAYALEKRRVYIKSRDVANEGIRADLARGPGAAVTPHAQTPSPKADPQHEIPELFLPEARVQSQKMTKRQQKHWAKVAARGHDQPKTNEQLQQEALAAAAAADARIAAREEGQLRQPSTQNAGVSQHRPNRCNDAATEPVTKIVRKHPGTNRMMPEHQMFGIPTPTTRAAVAAAAAQVEDPATQAEIDLAAALAALAGDRDQSSEICARREQRVRQAAIDADVERRVSEARRAEIRERVEVASPIRQEAEDAQKRKDRAALKKALGVEKPQVKAVFGHRAQYKPTSRRTFGAQFQQRSGYPCTRDVNGQPQKRVRH